MQIFPLRVRLFLDPQTKRPTRRSKILPLVAAALVDRFGSASSQQIEFRRVYGAWRRRNPFERGSLVCPRSRGIRSQPAGVNVDHREGLVHQTILPRSIAIRFRSARQRTPRLHRSASCRYRTGKPRLAPLRNLPRKTSPGHVFAIEARRTRLSDDRPNIDAYPLSPYVAWAGNRNKDAILKLQRTLSY